jgi:pSer/pThr/pTyr-binding forkhead associated (FHA) protein
VEIMTKLHILNGPKIGRSYELSDVATYVGRSFDNHIQIDDKTVSRKHLKIARRGNKYFVTDLKSRNGTFFNGNYIAPGLELEVKEGVPIAIGMSVICLGKGCEEQMMPFLDSIGLTQEPGEESGIFLEHRDRTNQRKLELLYRVSDLLTENLPINETLEKILDYIFNLLKRIDRAAFILVDPETEKILDLVSRTTKPSADTVPVYCPDVVKRVIENRKPLVISHNEIEEENNLLDTLKILKIESVMCVPLICSSHIMGVLYVDSLERPFGFRREDLSLFMDLCQRTALAVEHARLTFESTPTADELPSNI